MANHRTETDIDIENVPKDELAEERNIARGIGQEETQKRGQGGRP